jgi:hypothetical protein
MTSIPAPELAETLLTKQVDNAPSRLRAWVAPIGCVTILLAYAVFLFLYYAPATIHPDANGYWAQGSLIWQTGHSWFKPESDAQYIGMHWLLLEDDTYVSRYPPGFPVVIGLVQTFLGWQASVLVNPLLALATLLGTYLTLKRLAGPGWGIVAMLILAVNPAFTVHALTQISHMAVAFSIVWGFHFLIRWSDQHRLIDVFSAGLFLGWIPSTRYADAVVAIAVGIFLLLHIRRTPGIWKHYLAAFVGAMIPILPLLIRNQLLFGAFWKTGYALTNEQTGFSFQNLLDHGLPYLQMLQSGGLGMMFALGLIGMMCMLFVAGRRSIGVLLLTSTIPFLLVYMAYYWAMGVGAGGMGGNVAGAMRFLVPIVPLFVIAGVWVMSLALTNLPKPARVTIPLVVLAMQTLMYGPSMRDDINRSFERKSMLALATRELDQVAPAGSVVIADSSLLQQLDFVRKWKLADASVTNSRGGGGGGRPIGNMLGFGGGGDDTSDLPSPQQQAKREARAKLYTGSDRQKQIKFEGDVDAWAGKNAVYVVARENELSRLLPLARREEFEIVKRIETPKPPVEPETRNPMSRMGRGGPGGPGGAPGGRAPGRGGGPFGSFIQPGETFVIAKWVGTPK